MAEGQQEGRAEERLVELEIRYTHVERQVEELSQIVAAQQRTLDELVKHVGTLRARLAALGDPTTNERPPHY
jgi:uncharacterized coiled-coil protein SlyX